MDVTTPWQEVNPDGYFLRELPEDGHTQGLERSLPTPSGNVGGGCTGFGTGNAEKNEPRSLPWKLFPSDMPALASSGGVFCLQVDRTGSDRHGRYLLLSS